MLVVFYEAMRYDVTKNVIKLQAESKKDNDLLGCIPDDEVICKTETSDGKTIEYVELDTLSVIQQFVLKFQM